MLSKEQTCKYLHQMRKGVSRYVKKNINSMYITTKIDNENGYTVSENIKIDYNSKTGNIAISSGINYRDYRIYTIKRKKLNCNDEETVEKVSNWYNSSSECYKRLKKENPEYIRSRSKLYRKKKNDAFFNAYLEHLKEVPE